MEDNTEAVESSNNLSIEDKKQLTEQAFVACRDKIRSTMTFSPEEAIRLGGNYVAYDNDLATIIHDQLVAMSKVDETNEYPAQTVREGRIIFDAILANAQMGRPQMLKDYLKGEGEKFTRRPRNGYMMTAEEMEKLGKKLLELVDAIPDIDAPKFTPPPPAWET